MVTWEYPPHVVGGLGSHVGDLVPALDRAGVRVDVLTPALAEGPATEDLPGGGRIHRVPVPFAAIENLLPDVQAANVRLTAAAIELAVSRGPFDVIHAHDWMAGFAAITAKHQTKTPLVVTLHATERGRAGGGLHSDLNVAINGNEWWLCYEAWRVIATSGYMSSECQDFFGVPRAKIDVIPNGVVTEPFAGLPPRNHPDMVEFRRGFADDDEALVFHVGRIVGEKGTPVLVEAVPQVLAERPKTKFVVAGKGPMLEPLRRRVDELGVGRHVDFTGFISDADRNRLYRVADAAVFPSLYEPFGIVALEAMAAGAPVVVAKTGGLAEVVEHGRTGIHVYPDDPGSLSWGILHTLNRPDWAAARADAALRQLEARFDWDLIAADTRTVYERVVAERATADW